MFSIWHLTLGEILTCSTVTLEKRKSDYDALVKVWHKCKPEKNGQCTKLLKNGKNFVRVVHPDDVVQDKGKHPIEECKHLGLTTVAQHSLEADVVIIGQDWGAVKNYKTAWSMEPIGKFEGFGKKYTQNPYLRNLSKAVGMMLEGKEVDHSYLLKENKKIFMINSMLCLKQGINDAGEDDDSISIESGNYKRDWTTDCSSQFIPKILDIIQPKVVVTLGELVSQSLIGIVERCPDDRACMIPFKFVKTPLNLHPEHFIDLVKDVQNGNPILIKNKKRDSTFDMFPVFHCGARGIYTNRGLEEYCYRNKNSDRGTARADYLKMNKEKRKQANGGKYSIDLYLDDWKFIRNRLKELGCL